MGSPVSASLRVLVGSTTPSLAVEIAPQGAAVYIRLSDAPAVRTHEFESGALVDHDAEGAVVGFELLDPGEPDFAQVLERLKRRFAAEAPALDSIEAVPA